MLKSKSFINADSFDEKNLIRTISLRMPKFINDKQLVCY